MLMMLLLVLLLLLLLLLLLVVVLIPLYELRVRLGSIIVCNNQSAAKTVTYKSTA